MPELEDPVVAMLPNQSAHPISALAMSHNRKHAVVAGKDTLQLVEVTPAVRFSGLEEVLVLTGAARDAAGAVAVVPLHEYADDERAGRGHRHSRF